MNKPLVSIGLPVFNDAKYLKETIDSILNQTYKNIELIIVDDGSTDDSLEIINSFLDERIKVFVDGNNFGLAVRLNQITQSAKGYFLARMDADDIMHPDRIKIQCEILNKYLDIDVLGSNLYVINGKNQITGIRSKYIEDKFELWDCSSFLHPTIMARREWFLDNPYDTQARRAQDAVLWRNTSQTSSFKKISKPLLYYREEANAYYKKYFKSLPTFWLQFNKEKDFFWLKKYLKGLFLGCLYFLFNLFRNENILLKQRNDINFRTDN